MSLISVTAHFDGEQIRLDEPVEIEPNAKLIVTILPKPDEEHEAWLRLSLSNLQRAYADDEEGYPLEAIKEANPEYERG